MKNYCTKKVSYKTNESRGWFNCFDVNIDSKPIPKIINKRRVLMYIILAYDRINGEINVQFDKHPDTCPCCQNGIQPTLKGAYLNGIINDSQWLQIVCRCPRESCGLTFLAYYEDLYHKGKYFFRYSKPGMPKPPTIQDTIKKMSPSFEKIYNESVAAESYGLLEICGAGYRKSLEFLVKDYIISMGIKEETIKGLFMGKCIEEYIDDNAVKQVAKRAAWLGNDETHFCRKWVDKDLTDLKRLLHLTMNAIDNKIITKQYTEEMTESI
jgi:hypothetical protein